MPNPTPSATLFAVDDTESARRIIAAAFADDYEVETFASAEDALQRLQTCQPDLLLLDVVLPGMDGYTMCRAMKQNERLAPIPVIFISARDDLESCLAGYEAGGIDFLVKPYKIKELRQKVRLALADIAHHGALQQQASDRDEANSMLNANLDELALLIRFLRTLNTCRSRSDVADLMFALVSNFNLDATIQLRSGDIEENYTPNGIGSSPHDTVIRHLREMGRIVEYKNRLACNHTHITLLINNMPVTDEELRERLRDHLDVAVQSADSRLEALQAMAQRGRIADSIFLLRDTLLATMADFSRRHESARFLGSTLTQTLTEDLTAAFAQLGMSAEQEDRLLAIVQGQIDGLIELYDFGDDLQAGLREIHQQLGAMLAPRG